METILGPKKVPKFHCKDCDYYTNKISHWKRHIETKKHFGHEKGAFGHEKGAFFCLCGKSYCDRSGLYKHQKSCESIQKNGNNYHKITIFEKCPFLCICGKSYKHKSGLSRHKRTCNYVKDEENNELKVIIKDLIENNKSLQEDLVKLAREPKIVHNTTNNNQLNVMNYLNNDCKDAMNLTDFINNFTFSLQDLEMLHTIGYHETMERTFVRRLKEMEKTKRPIHCSDKKRKSFYIKDNNVWEKDEDNKKLIVSVKQIATKQFGAINNWRHHNVDWLENDTKHNFFNKSVMEVGKCDNVKEMNKVLNHLTCLGLRK